MTEAKEILRARQGDETAWETLVRRHQEAVFRYAYLLLGDADQAEDAAQETFISAYQALDRFDPERPIRPWLMKIAANRTRNQRRSVSRYLAYLAHFFHNYAPTNEDVEQRVIQDLQAEALWQAIRALKQDDQQVIYLRYFLDMPVAEAAEALGIPEGTVKSRLSRALERLRRAILKQNPALKGDFDSG